MSEASDLLVDILKPARLTAVVDVGANPIDGDPPYKSLLAARLCSVVGFEPQPEALATLNSRKSDLETYLPYVVHDGAPATLRVCRSSGMTSLLRPDAQIATYFRGFGDWGHVVNEASVETRRLDDLSEIAELDFLKIDVQGAELTVFQHGAHRLKAAVAIQTEISFVRLYEQQPSYGQIDLELRGLGFVPHCFAAIKNWMISPMFVENNPYAAINQLLEADIVYVRDFTKPENMQVEQFKHLAMIAHHCYRSFDLVVNCLYRLVERGAIAPDSIARYTAQGIKR
jgi:FkbM family methyltransferase